MNSPVQGRAEAELNSFNLLALAERVAALAPHVALLIVSVIAAIFVSVVRLHAQEPASVTLDDVKSGSLLLRTTEQGRFVEAPRLGTDIDLSISGPTARARVTQAFRNPTDGWIEAGIDPRAAGRRLVLATCWPLDAKTAGPLRYLVHAEMMEQAISLKQGN
jgi:hypothetical protein